MERGRYEYLDDIATADVAFRAYGKTLEEMLIAATDATLEVMLPEPETLEARVKREIQVSAENAEMLLYKLLEELVYLKDAEQLLLRVERIEARQAALLEATAECAGDTIDAEKYVLGVDVKAVTMHLFSVKNAGGVWEAQVILDI
jgi:SHS2 domain-containing protein